MTSEHTQELAWVIQDWTSKVLWDGKQFNSFEEGWGWIYEQDPMPDESHPDYNSYYDDYYVVEIERKVTNA